jgi:nucleoside-triphosphatase THEP1
MSKSDEIARLERETRKIHNDIDEWLDENEGGVALLSRRN